MADLEDKTLDFFEYSEEIADLGTLLVQVLNAIDRPKEAELLRTLVQNLERYSLHPRVFGMVVDNVDNLILHGKDLTDREGTLLLIGEIFETVESVGAEVLLACEKPLPENAPVLEPFEFTHTDGSFAAMLAGNDESDDLTELRLVLLENFFNQLPSDKPCRFDVLHVLAGYARRVGCLGAFFDQITEFPKYANQWMIDPPMQLAFLTNVAEGLAEQGLPDKAFKCALLQLAVLPSDLSAAGATVASVLRRLMAITDDRKPLVALPASLDEACAKVNLGPWGEIFAAFRKGDVSAFKALCAANPVISKEYGLLEGAIFDNAVTLALVNKFVGVEERSMDELIAEIGVDRDLLEDVVVRGASEGLFRARIDDSTGMVRVSGPRAIFVEADWAALHLRLSTWKDGIDALQNRMGGLLRPDAGAEGEVDTAT